MPESLSQMDRSPEDSIVSPLFATTCKNDRFVRLATCLEGDKNKPDEWNFWLLMMSAVQFPFPLLRQKELISKNFIIFLNDLMKVVKGNGFLPAVHSLSGDPDTEFCSERVPLIHCCSLRSFKDRGGLCSKYQSNLFVCFDFFSTAVRCCYSFLPPVVNSAPSFFFLPFFLDRISRKLNACDIRLAEIHYQLLMSTTARR